MADLNDVPMAPTPGMVHVKNTDTGEIQRVFPVDAVEIIRVHDNYVMCDAETEAAIGRLNVGEFRAAQKEAEARKSAKAAAKPAAPAAPAKEAAKS